MSMSAKRIVADQFIRDITERPDDFVIETHRVIDTKTKREWWTANKGYGFKLDSPFRFDIGNTGSRYSYHGNRCYRAYKRFLGTRLGVLLNRIPTP